MMYCWEVFRFELFFGNHGVADSLASSEMGFGSEGYSFDDGVCFEG